MYVLVAKILAPVVVFCTTVVSEWSRLRDASTRRQAMRRVTMGAAVTVALSAGLVVDHWNQTAAVETAQKDAVEAQAARQNIQESLDEQDADLSAARGELAETQESLSRLEGWARRSRGHHAGAGSEPYTAGGVGSHRRRTTRAAGAIRPIMRTSSQV